MFFIMRKTQLSTYISNSYYIFLCLTLSEYIHITNVKKRTFSNYQNDH